ncbi:MAG: hypothetical protein AAFV53_29295 [Myxococcota bacterium]
MFYAARWAALGLLVGACTWRNQPFPEPLAEGTVGRSNVVIPAGAAFMVGGNQSGPLTVHARSVRGAVLLQNGDAQQRQPLASGETGSLTVAAGDAVIFRATKGRAQVKVTVTQTSDERLGMVFAGPGEPLRTELVGMERPRTP